MRALLTPRRLAATALCAALLPIGACTPEGPPVDPPSPTPSVTTDPATPSPSLSQEAKDSAEAEEAYRQANQLVDRALMVKGKKKIPAELSEFADPQGPWYINQADGVARYNKEGLRFSKETTVIEARTARHVSADRIILFICADGREVKILDQNDKVSGQTIMAAGYLTMRRSDEFGWRVFGYDERGLVEVDKCSEGELQPSDVPS